MDDLLGWKNTRWGMTEGDLILALQDVRLDRMSYKLTASGYQATDLHQMHYDILIRDTDVGGVEFNVLFLMVAGQDHPSLAQVRLISTADDYGLKIRSTSVTSVRKVISEKYGKPVRDGSSGDFVWQFPTTTILMWHSLPYQIGISFMPSIVFKPAATSI